MQQFFLGCTGPHFGPTNTNHAKNYQKITFGALFRIPPQNALQCTTVQCNVLKCKRLNYSLQMGQIRPIMTQDVCAYKQMQINLSEIDLEVIPRDEGALWHVLLHAFNCLFVLQGIVCY